MGNRCRICDQFPEMARFRVMKHLAVGDSQSGHHAAMSVSATSPFPSNLPIAGSANAQPFTRSLVDLKTLIEQTA